MVLFTKRKACLYLWLNLKKAITVIIMPLTILAIPLIVYHNLSMLTPVYVVSVYTMIYCVPSYLGLFTPYAI